MGNDDAGELSPVGRAWARVAAARSRLVPVVEPDVEPDEPTQPASAEPVAAVEPDVEPDEPTQPAAAEPVAVVEPERTRGGSRPFSHLHTHSARSLLDSIADVDDLVAAAAGDGQPALAITDHGNLAAAPRLVASAEAAGIKPILGEELYMAFGSRHEHNEGAAADDEPSAGRKGKKRGKSNQHLTVLASTPEGWQNLMAVSSEAHDTTWHKPRADFDLLAEHSAGLIVLTGCLGGPVAGPLVAGDYDRAASNLSRLVDIFGVGQVYVEMMSHGIPDEQRIADQLVRLSRRFGLGVVATNDAHHVREADAATHEAWLCVSTKTRLDDPGRWKFHGTGYHLRSAAEMRNLFDRQPGTERACDTTLEIAERIDARVLPARRVHLPAWIDPDGCPAGEVLRSMSLAGAGERWGSPIPDEALARLNHELSVIDQMGFSDYFLIVSDMIRWAKSQGIRTGPGRGSAAGCAVSYAIGITDVDPIANGLMFERFLNPSRKKMPDIDTDFEVDRRDEVVAYLVERWGADRVARLGTVGVDWGRGALRSAGRVLGSQDLAGVISPKVPDLAGEKRMRLPVLLDPKVPDGAALRRAVADGGDEAKRLADLAVAIEGIPRSVGTHACGTVISDVPLVEVAPLRRDPKVRAGGVAAVTEWDGEEIEAAGLLKLDVLGLRNLDAITAALRNIERTTGEHVDVSRLPTTGERAERTWRMLSAGDTSGVFQLESAGMRDLCRNIRPDSLNDLAALIALFRPGPLGEKMHERYAERKAGNEPVDYQIFTSHPDEIAVIASILDDTYGVPVYQEQIMQLAAAVAGFSGADCDNLIRAISKKHLDEMASIGKRFVTDAQSDRAHDGAPKVAFSGEASERLWDAFKAAGNYCFNKAHSFGYATLSYQTAFLRANWPAEYGAALLAHTGDAGRRQSILRSLAEDGVKVSGPDLNVSGVGTSVTPDRVVRFGLGEVKGVGANATAIVAERDTNGLFGSLADAVCRTKARGRAVPTNVWAALVTSGAADTFGARCGQTEILGQLRKHPDTTIPDIEWGPEERARRERACLGVLVSESPLRTLAAQLVAWESPSGTSRPRNRLHELPEHGRTFWSVGILTRFEPVEIGVRRAYLTLEGLGGSADGIMWSDGLDRLEKQGWVPEVGRIVVVSGRTQARQARTPRADDDSETVDETRLEMVVERIGRGPLEDVWGRTDEPRALHANTLGGD